MGSQDAVWLNAYREAEVAGEIAASESQEAMLQIAGHKPFPACGFAWIVVRPGNCPFANWLKKNKNAKRHHAGGVSLWVSKYGQSHDKKKEYARAFADSIEHNLILTQIAPNMTVQAESRLD